MNTTFNFGALSSVNPSSKAHLKPYTITDVKWGGAKIVSGVGKTSGKEWKALEVTFESEQGSHTERLFLPDVNNQQDTTDKEFPQANGGVKKAPSNIATFMQYIAHFASVLTPEGFEKLKAVSSKLKTAEDLAKAFIQITDPVKGKETKLKLVGKNDNGAVYARFPRPLGVNSKNEFFPVNIIGEGLFLSPYEKQQEAAYLNAKPSKMKSVLDDSINGDTNLGIDDSDEELDLDLSLD
jgi:hypothetical protein